jgi:hypothetical protein
MSRGINRSDVLDYQTYTEQRPTIQAEVLAIKAPRRMHVGEYLTFLFENRATLTYQIQEMMRVERIVKEADIQHEIDTYSAVLGGPGGLGCTLLIEIQDSDARDVLLKKWLQLPQRLYLRLPDGSQVRPTFDEAQVGDDRLSSVQYLKFDLGGETPIAIGADHPDLTAEHVLTEIQREALAADLAESQRA